MFQEFLWQEYFESLKKKMETCTEIQSRRDFFEWYFGGLFDGELYFWPCSTAKIFSNLTFDSCE